MPTQEFKHRLLRNVHCSWIELLSNALESVDSDFLDSLESSPNWLPGIDKCFAAFSVPRCDVKVVWLGESPYPRAESANGLSFCDDRIQNLFQNGRGLSSQMGTSLRNILKAWFVATERLTIDNTNQRDICHMCRSGLIVEMSELFNRGQTHGWLWLNATLSFWPEPSEAQPSLGLQICKWLPLVETVLRDVSRRGARVVLLGKFAEEFAYMVNNPLIAPHPAIRNRSFVRNAGMRSFLHEWRCLIEQ